MSNANPQLLQRYRTMAVWGGAILGGITAAAAYRAAAEMGGGGK